MAEQNQHDDPNPKPPIPDQPPAPNPTSRRISLIIVAALSSLAGNVITNYIQINRIWPIAAIWFLLLAVELWLTATEGSGRLSSRMLSLLQIPGHLWRKHPIFTVTAMLLFLLAGAGFAASQLRAEPPYCPSGKVCILIAHLSPPETAKAQEITLHIQNRIQFVLGRATVFGMRDLVVAMAPPVETIQAAWALARRESALLTIWGEVRTTEDKTDIHFEVADLLSIGDSAQVRPYRALPLFYDPVGGWLECINCMGIAGAVTRQADVVAYFAVGLAHYAAGQPEAGQPNFLAALYCAGEDVARALLPERPDCTPSNETGPAETALISYYLGKSYVLQGDYRQGIAYLNAAAEASPNDPAAWIAIGEAYTNWYGEALSDPPPAAAAFVNAEQAVRGLPAATLGTERDFALGLIYELQGELAAAMAEYQKAANSFSADDPSGYVSLLALARVQSQTGLSEEAEANLRRATELLADASWAHLELARLLVDDRMEAEAAIERARSATPNEAYVSITEAELCADWGDRACAAEAYLRALQIRPNSGWLHSRIGDFYLPTTPPVAGQSWEEAEIHYRRATELRPADPWVHQRLGYVLLNRNQNGEAAVEYEMAIALLPDDPLPGDLSCTLAEAQRRAGLPVTGLCP
ncbi:MAG: hypothetical protein KF753_02700 [Caldilineaceae bacterium]|nr:hypothetical protein [Caldilineaceae bacterium]